MQIEGKVKRPLIALAMGILVCLACGGWGAFWLISQPIPTEGSLKLPDDLGEVRFLRSWLKRTMDDTEGLTRESVELSARGRGFGLFELWTVAGGRADIDVFLSDSNGKPPRYVLFVPGRVQSGNAIGVALDLTTGRTHAVVQNEDVVYLAEIGHYYVAPSSGIDSDGSAWVTAGGGPKGIRSDESFDRTRMRHLGPIDGMSVKFVPETDIP